jgi:hypothetical protein
MFQRGFVTRLNQAKNPKKQNSRVEKALSMLKTLLITAKAVNMTNESPPKQRVIRSVCLKVMMVAGVGLKKENGHQIKSLSDSQL